MTVTTTYQLTETKAEFTANGFLSGTQTLPDVLGLKDGGFAVAYHNADQTLIDFYDADYKLIANVPVPSIGTTAANGEPSITELSNGRVLVVWEEDSSANGKIPGMHGAIYEADGALVIADIALTSMPLAGISQVDVTTLSNGNFVVSYDFNGSEFFRIYNSSGAQIEGPIGSNTTFAGIQGEQQVLALKEDGFVTVWTDFNTSPTVIRARIFDNGGDERKAEFNIDTVGSNSQPALAALDNGNWAIAYADTGWGGAEAGSTGITLKIYDEIGGLVKPAVHVNTPTSLAEADPDITVLDNGFIVVTWTKAFNGSDHDIRGRIFDQDGNAIPLNGSTAEFALTLANDLDIKSAVSGLLNGQFITAWQDGGSTDIKAVVKQLVRTIDGDAASNVLTGDTLPDAIFGNGGNDTITGGGGSDTLRGGEADDTFVFVQADVASGEIIDGGIGADTIVAKESWDNAVDFSGSKIAGIEKIVIDSAIAGLETRFDASAFGSNGIAANALIQGSANSANPSFDTLALQMGADALLDLSGLQFANWEDGFDVVLVEGDDSAETVTGSSQNDSIYGAGGGDKLTGGAGQDHINGGAGKDTLAGGDDFDVVSYLDDVAAVKVNLTLAAAQDTGGSGVDRLSGFEGITGSSFNDTLTGGVGDNTITGSGGDDIVAGGAGEDFLAGNNGKDTLDYAASAAAVTVDLEAQTAAGGDAQGDVIAEFENVIGSKFADKLTGDDFENILRGAGGADTVNGGLGKDTASYLGAAASVQISLDGSLAAKGEAIGDVLTSIENLTGADLAGAGDLLRGDAGMNVLAGLAGNDQLQGLGDKDTLDGGAGNDVIEGGAGTDGLYGGAGTGDMLVYASSDAAVTIDLQFALSSGGHAAGDFISGFESVTGTKFGDNLSGDNNENILIGGAGADTLDGGNGLDTATYQSSSASIKLALDGSFAGTGHALGDVLYEVEKIVGANINGAGDHLRGSNSVESLSGLAGNDLLEGLGGSDTLLGGNGNDTLVGGVLGDTLTGGAGKDEFRFGYFDGTDVITDFDPAFDFLSIKASEFGGGLVAGQALGAGRLVANADPAPTKPFGQFLYETDTGKLRWDDDGNDGGAGNIIATFSNKPVLTVADFQII